MQFLKVSPNAARSLGMSGSVGIGAVADPLRCGGGGCALLWRLWRRRWLKNKGHAGVLPVAAHTVKNVNANYRCHRLRNLEMSLFGWRVKGEGTAEQAGALN
jgi:hypothetical protein